MIFCDHFNMIGGGDADESHRRQCFFYNVFLVSFYIFDKSTRNESELSLA